MKVVVNGRFLSRQVTGVERYGQEILHCLAGRTRTVRPPERVQVALGHAWEQFVLPGLLSPGEILWSPANTGPLRVTSQALTLHDLSCLEHPEWYAPAFALWHRLYLPILIRRVRHVLVSSEHVRKKILNRFTLSPERVTVVPGGVDLNRFRPSSLVPGKTSPGYLLFVGSLQPRKNLAVLLQAWELISQYFPNTRLLIAGAEGPVFRKIALPNNLDRVQFLGYVPEDDLPSLYAGALALIFPSLDEGFGLPALEAMACRVPVIAADAGALPEVLGEAGLLFDPRSPAELANLLERCLSDEKLRQELAEKGQEQAENFSWERSAEKIWEVLQTCR